MADLLRSAEKLSCNLISGKAADWPKDCPADLSCLVIEFAEKHGISMLLSFLLQSHPDSPSWPSELRGELMRRHRAFAAADLLQSKEMQRVLDAFAAAGIRPILMKGMALAQSHYPLSSCRERCDADMLFEAGQIEKAKTILSNLGYAFPNAVSGELVSSQMSAYRVLAGDFSMALDMHWKINNMPLLGDVFGYAQAKRRAVAVPALGGNALALCPVHALLLACLHRAGHLRETYCLDGKTFSQGDRLIWLYDIHLLLQSMSPEECSEFAVLARDRQILNLCRDAIEQAQQRFATYLPEQLLESLATTANDEASLCYLKNRHAGRFTNTLSDIYLLPDFKSRLSLLREYLLPPADYMQNKYRCRWRALLPFLYLWRMIAGTRKLFQ